MRKLTFPRKCQLCHGSTRLFKNSRALNLHIRHAHADGEIVRDTSGRYPCPVPGCTRRFAKKLGRACHVRHAHGLKMLKGRLVTPVQEIPVTRDTLRDFDNCQQRQIDDAMLTRPGPIDPTPTVVAAVLAGIKSIPIVRCVDGRWSAEWRVDDEAAAIMFVNYITDLRRDTR